MENPTITSPDERSPCLVEDQENINQHETMDMGRAERLQKYKNHTGVKAHLTTVAHFCIFLFVFLILYLCFTNEFVFFTWHPVLLSIGWMLLMSEAILTISRDNILTRSLSYHVRVKYHWIIQAAAATLIAIGFAVVFINKNRLNKTHFKSWHAFLGLVGMACAIPTCLNGVAALFNVSLKNYVKPRILKFVHLTSGLMTFIFGGLSLVLSVYTNWFGKMTGHNGFVFYYGLVCVGFAMVWTLFRPLLTFFNHVRLQMKKP